MQLTKEKCDQQIGLVQQEITELQLKMNRLMGYRQALIDWMEEKEDYTVPKEFNN